DVALVRVVGVDLDVTVVGVVQRHDADAAVGGVGVGLRLLAAGRLRAGRRGALDLDVAVDLESRGTAVADGAHGAGAAGGGARRGGGGLGGAGRGEGAGDLGPGAGAFFETGLRVLRGVFLLPPAADDDSWPSDTSSLSSTGGVKSPEVAGRGGTARVARGDLG